MNIGYPCINLSLPFRSSKTFRLASFSEERFHETVTNNLSSLETILRWNNEHSILFFRITSDLIPFASHPICTIPWQKVYKDSFKKLGIFIKQSHMRVSLHPDQFTLINSPSEQIFQNSLRELIYQEEILSLMELDSTHKLQIHVGGVYADKEVSTKRFIARYKTLPQEIKNRLVIENDERLYSIKDCLTIHEQTGIPILFDSLHHEINNNRETLHEVFSATKQTWNEDKDGIPIIDYSSQDPTKRIGAHTPTIDLELFKRFIAEIKGFDVDIMLEIKDKEKSCLKAISFLSHV